MTNSSSRRLEHAFGAQGGGGLADMLGGLLGSGGSGGGLGDMLGGLMGGGQKGLGRGASAGLGNLGGMLQSILGEASQAVGGQKNLALGGLGALAGSILGGKGASVKGALGGGAMAMLGALAFKALKGTMGPQEPEVPLGLREPADEAETEQLEENAAWVLKAMLNAAKADGQISPEEIERILGKLQEDGLDKAEHDMLMTEMNKPLDLDGLCRAAAGKPELGAQIYAASLLAIEVDTPAEQEYMSRLGQGLGLSPEATQRLEAMVGFNAPG
ncbi:MAG: tellurite resistance TerB family protein [Desulfobacterales bacterium]